MTSTTAKFSVGQLVHHRLFDYRGVVIDVDSHFLGSEDWYKKIAQTRPPKDTPWYHVLVDGVEHRTYVAERNLENDTCTDPVKHSEIGTFFSALGDDGYVLLNKRN